MIFRREELIEQELLSCRGAKAFEERYLRKSFDAKISVIRILDSRKEKFKLSKPYENKIDVVNIITAPEIEILMILNEGKYQDFKKSKLKPSDFCKQVLKMHQVKNYDFVYDYFSDANNLVSILRRYKKLPNVPDGELSLTDLLLDK